MGLEMIFKLLKTTVLAVMIVLTTSCEGPSTDKIMYDYIDESDATINSPPRSLDNAMWSDMETTPIWIDTTKTKLIAKYLDGGRYVEIDRLIWKELTGTDSPTTGVLLLIELPYIEHCHTNVRWCAKSKLAWFTIGVISKSVRIIVTKRAALVVLPSKPYNIFAQCSAAS